LLVVIEKLLREHLENLCLLPNYSRQVRFRFVKETFFSSENRLLDYGCASLFEHASYIFFKRKKSSILAEFSIGAF